MPAPILIVEDEVKIATLLQDYCHQAVYETKLIHNGREAKDWLQKNEAKLILLDLMLPEVDGITICKELRKTSETPIIMVTAKVEEIDRLIGLELGADDYICKPFSPREVVARVKAVLRRTQSLGHTSSATETTSLKPKVIELDPDKYQARVFDTPVELTAIEFNLLQVLAKEPGRIYSRLQLINHVYQDHRVVSERTIDSHIKKLRKKLNDIKPDMELVQSVYSVGYKLEYK